MARNYLHECLAAFPEITERMYGTASDMRAVEAAVAPLRTRKSLTFEDLRLFEAPDNWAFKMWWVFPPEEHVKSALRDRPLDFAALPKGEKELIASLLEVFKSIELVSIILRFVRPEHYGIISSPVARVLDSTQQSNPVRTYLAYLDDLRGVRKSYGFKRAADADMALLMLHEKCFGTLPEQRMRRQYEEDSFMRRIRAANLLARITADWSEAQLADALLETDRKFAARIGGIAFEQMVRRFAGGQRSDHEDLRAIIDRLYNEGKIDRIRRDSWERARRTRNQAVHGERPPSQEDVAALIGLLDKSR